MPRYPPDIGPLESIPSRWRPFRSSHPGSFGEYHGSFATLWIEPKVPPCPRRRIGPSTSSSPRAFPMDAADSSPWFVASNWFFAGYRRFSFIILLFNQVGIDDGSSHFQQSLLHLLILFRGEVSRDLSRGFTQDLEDDAFLIIGRDIQRMSIFLA